VITLQRTKKVECAVSRKIQAMQTLVTYWIRGEEKRGTGKAKGEWKRELL